MKKEMSFANDDIVYHLEKWFENHRCLSIENYQMLKHLVWYMRERVRKK